MLLADWRGLLQMKISKDIKILCIASILSLLIAACGQKEIQPQKIGLVGTFSGNNSGVGVSGRNGALLAVEEINEQGGVQGHPVELVTADTGNVPKQALAAITSLDQQGVKLIIGPFMSGMAVPMLGYCQTNKVLLISPTVSSESFTGKDDYFIRFIPSNRLQSKTLARVAWEQDHIQKVFAIFDEANRAFSEEVCHWFETYFTEKGGSVVAYSSFDTNLNPDYLSLAAKVIASKADGVLCVANGVDTGLLSQALRNEGYTGNIYGAMWGMSSDLIENGGKAVEGATFPSTLDLNNQNEAFVAFNQAYEAKYQQKPTFASLLAYESTLYLLEALQKLDDFDPDSVKAALVGQRFTGLQDGEFLLDIYGDAQRNYQAFTVKNAAYVKKE